MYNSKKIRVILSSLLCVVIFLSTFLGVEASVYAASQEKFNKSNQIADLQDSLNRLINDLNESNNKTYLIEYKDDLNNDSKIKGKSDKEKERKIKEKVRNVGGNIKKEYNNFNVIKASLSDEMVQKLNNDPEIYRIEQDYYFSIQSETVPWGIESIGATKAHERGVNGKDIKIAVFDTGISEHSDLSISGGISFVSDVESYSDDNGHGTHVAGIINSAINGYGVAGVSPSASLYSVKVLNSQGIGSYSSTIEGIEWCIDNDIDIINMSLGATNYSEILKNAIDRACENNILIFAAAGNRSSSAIDYPAAYDSVIAVGAVDKNKNKAYFSNIGSELDLVAPGVDILSTLKNGDYGYLSGTSMSSPHAAGAAALLWSIDPNVSGYKIRDLLYMSARNLGDSFEFGNGMVDVNYALNMYDSFISTSSDNTTPSESTNITVTDTVYKDTDKIINVPPNNTLSKNGKVAKPLVFDNSSNDVSMKEPIILPNSGSEDIIQDIKIQNVSALSYITEVEPNDTYSTAMPLGIGTVEGNTASASDCDWYIVNLEANKEYTINLKGIQTGNDLDLYLYNSQLDSLEYSLSYGNSDESITITPTATGNYYIYVHNYEFLATGEHTYQLMLYSNDTTPDSYEPNDSITTSKVINLNVPVKGNININTDEDWYAVNVDEPGRITVTLDNIPLGCDYDIAVYDESTSVLGGSYFSGNESEKASIIVSNPGTYYIRVYSYSGSNYLNNYELNVVLSIPDTYEINDFFDDAKPIMVGDYINATIDNKNDDDWFSVNISEVGNYSFELQNIPSGTDYDIYIYDYSDNVISASLFGGNTNEFINISLEPGRYYIQVHPFSGYSSVHQYLLSVYKENTLCIEMPNCSTNSGDVIQIPVNINNLPSEGICNFDFVIEYDKDILTYTGVEAGSLTVASGEGFAVQECSSGLKVLFYTNTSDFSDNINDSGELFKLNFQVNSTVSDGAYKISYGDIWCFGKQTSEGVIEKVEKVVFKPGLIYIGSYNINNFQSVSYIGTEEILCDLATYKHGDVNADGYINSIDMAYFRKHLLGLGNLTGDNLKAADVNGDGNVNSLDFAYVRQYLLGLIGYFPAPPIVNLISPSLTLSNPYLSPYSLGDSIKIKAEGSNCHHISLFINDQYITEQKGNDFNYYFTPTSSGTYYIQVKARNDVQPNGILVSSSSAIVVVGTNVNTNSPIFNTEIISAISVGTVSEIADALFASYVGALKEYSSSTLGVGQMEITMIKSKLGVSITKSISKYTGPAAVVLTAYEVYNDWNYYSTNEDRAKAIAMTIATTALSIAAGVTIGGLGLTVVPTIALCVVSGWAMDKIGDAILKEWLKY